MLMVATVCHSNLASVTIDLASLRTAMPGRKERCVGFPPLARLCFTRIIPASIYHSPSPLLKIDCTCHMGSSHIPLGSQHVAHSEYHSWREYTSTPQKYREGTPISARTPSSRRAPHSKVRHDDGWYVRDTLGGVIYSSCSPDGVWSHKIRDTAPLLS